MTTHQGPHFLQIPGPSLVPYRVLRAMDMPVIDHRSSEFAELAKAVLEGSQKIFKTAGPVIIFPSSGTGAWEAAIVNTLSPGDKVLMVETGHFATLWQQMAARWGIAVDFMPGDWRHGADPAAIEAKLAQDSSHAIKAVMVVHNETSTGVTSRIGDIRAVMDQVGHPALLLVIRFPRWARSNTGMTSGKSTSPSAVRKRDLCCRRGSASTRSPRKPAPLRRPTGCRGPTGTGKRC